MTAVRIVQIIKAPKHLWLPEVHDGEPHDGPKGTFGYTQTHHRVAYIALVEDAAHINAKWLTTERWVEYRNLDGLALNQDITWASGPCEERETADRWYCEGHWIEVWRPAPAKPAPSSEKLSG